MREKEYLGERYAVILSSVGIILLLSGVLMLTPLTALLTNPQEAAHASAFGLPAGCLFLLGIVLWQWFRIPSKTPLSIQEGGIIVLLSWILVILFSAWPFISVLGLSFSRALFESVSGWTTTGLSVIDVSVTGPMVFLWRSIIQLSGGAGLAIIMMSSILGPTGIGISFAEGRSNQLVPQVRQSARLVLMIYSCYAAAGALAYWLAGMSPFDAVNHSFCAISTGGFSTHPESIGYWNSTAIEVVTLVLMLLGNLSFVTAWFLWRGKLGVVLRNGEIRLLGVIVFSAITLMFLLVTQEHYPQFEKAIRITCFAIITAITTTGFSTVDYGTWNVFGVWLLIILMVIGGGTCSTAGGIKQFRLYLLCKLFIWDIKSYLMPKNAIQERPIWEGNRRVFVDDARVRQVTVFIFLYLVTYGLGVMILCACGFSLRDSLFEFASAIGTVGLSVGVTSAQMPDVALWAEIFAMFLGRLEFIVIIVSLFKLAKDGFWIISETVNELF